MHAFKNPCNLTQKIYTLISISFFKKYCCYLHYYNGTCYIFKSSGRATIINFLDYLETFEKNLRHGLPPWINPKTPYHNRIYCCVYKIICLCVWRWNCKKIGLMHEWFSKEIISVVGWKSGRVLKFSWWEINNATSVLLLL